MRWEDEQFVKVYTRDTVDWLALSYDARSLFLNLLRKVDRAGILPLGRHGRRGVAVLLNAMDLWETRLSGALAELELDGCLRVDGDSLVIPNFTAAQEARQTDRARKQAQRERDRQTAMGGLSVTARDAIAQIERSASHEVTPEVTRGHTASREVTLRRDETRREETREDSFSASRSAGAEASGEDAPTRPPLVLEPSPSDAPPEEPKKRERRLSAAEELYAAIQRARRVRCEDTAEPFVEDRWDNARQNKNLGPVAKGSAEERKRFEGAFGEFLADEQWKPKGWPLSLFMSGAVRSRYEKQALDAEKGEA